MTTIPGAERAALSGALAAVVLAFACTTDPPSPMQSQPVATETTLVMGAGPVAQPVTGSQLKAVWPVLQGLETVPMLVVEGVMNTEPAPCLPCGLADRSLADCALAPPAGCENLAELVARAARVAAAGGSPQAVRAVVTYGEPWLPEPGVASPGWPDPDAPVQVELWLDPSWGPWREAVSRADALVTLGRTDASVGPVAVHIRLFPTWALQDGGVAPAGAPALHGALAAADVLGQGLPYARALAASAELPDEAALLAAASAVGLDTDAWQQARGAAASQRLELDARAVTALELRSAPSWRVDGYRLRGHRTLGGLQDVVENQQLDHLAEIPAPLLAPWDPGLPAVSPNTTPPASPPDTP